MNTAERANIQSVLKSLSSSSANLEYFISVMNSHIHFQPLGNGVMRSLVFACLCLTKGKPKKFSLEQDANPYPLRYRFSTSAPPIGHLPVHLCLLFKASLSAKFFI